MYNTCTCTCTEYISVISMRGDMYTMKTGRKHVHTIHRSVYDFVKGGGKFRRVITLLRKVNCNRLRKQAGLILACYTCVIC